MGCAPSRCFSSRQKVQSSTNGYPLVAPTTCTTGRVAAPVASAPKPMTEAVGGAQSPSLSAHAPGHCVESAIEEAPSVIGSIHAPSSIHVSRPEAPKGNADDKIDNDEPSVASGYGEVRDGSGEAEDSSDGSDDVGESGGFENLQDVELSDGATGDSRNTGSVESDEVVEGVEEETEGSDEDEEGEQVDVGDDEDEGSMDDDEDDDEDEDEDEDEDDAEDDDEEDDGDDDDEDNTEESDQLVGEVQGGDTPQEDKSNDMDGWDDGDEEMDPEFVRLRKQCGRFRVLVIGKANAGKTTILQKMCNTTEAPVIHNQEGVEIDQSFIRPTDGRGIHDINNELTFSSNRAFVFHDSPGFEAGSIRELEDVRDFISKRAAAKELKEQLHAIWYCLPTDNDRPLSDAEMSFFQQGTGRTPVIAIFTKYDGMILKEYNRLRYEGGFDKTKAMQLAPKFADELFLESQFYLKRIQSAPYPPTRWLRVQDMQRSENGCAELSRQTLEALDSKILQQLFVSVQQNNIELSTEYCIKHYIQQALVQVIVPSAFPQAAEMMARHILGSYCHMFSASEEYGNRDTTDKFFINREAWAKNGFFTNKFYFEKLLNLVQPAFPTLAGQGSYYFQTLRLATAILILAEDSFWLKSGGVLDSALQPALEGFQESARNLAVIKEIDQRFTENSIKMMVFDTNGEGESFKVVLEIVKKFRVQR